METPESTPAEVNPEEQQEGDGEGNGNGEGGGSGFDTGGGDEPSSA
jgi:hypothetical protein